MNIVSKFLGLSIVFFCATVSITACSSKGGDNNPAPTGPTITRRSLLNDKQIVSSTPPVSSATGTATVTLNAATGGLSGTVTLSNLTTAVLAVTINDGDFGVNGSPVVSLEETPLGSGIWTIPQTTTALTAAQMDSYKAAGFHIIVETSSNPNGEIRGQLLSFADNIQPIFDQNCASCHSAAGAASATGLFLDQASSYSSLVNQTAKLSPGTRVVPFDADNSVLMQRLLGTNGLIQMPPAGPLPAPETLLIKAWIIMGAISDSDTFPVPPAPRTLFTRRALLQSGQVVAGPVSSSLTGTAAVTLNTASNQLTGTVTLTDPAHIATAVIMNDGDVGTTGGQVVPLTETPAGSGSWTIPATTLSAAQTNRFINAGFYVSVDTAANPNGEIRGQLLSYADNVQPIFDTNCTSCHFASGPASFTGLLLLSANSYTTLVNKPAFRSTGVRVVPSDANNSVLLQRIAGTGPASVVGSQMPPPESKRPALSQRDQDIIKTWINMAAIDDSGAVKTPSAQPVRQFIREAFLNPAQVVPALASSAIATATFSLNEFTSRLSGTVTITNVPDVAAGRLVVSVHVNSAYADSAGPALPIAFLETPIGSGVFTIPSTATTMTTTQMNQFIAGGLYVAVDTQLLGIPREEVRGQIQTFKDNVQQLFNGRCVKCHNPGFLTLVAGQSYAALVNRPATQSAGTLVLPFDSAGSVLYNRLTGTGFPTGRMPADGPPYLTSNETSIIKAWIVMGAPND
jgi:hypothetical protein